MLRRGHPDLESGLQIGLIEAGEHALGIGGLELRVQVGLAVNRVDETMQAFAGVGVPAVGIDDDDIAMRQPAQGDSGGFVVTRDIQLLAVEAGAADALGGDVDHRIGAGQRVEHHGGGRAERALAGHIEVDLVTVDRDQGGAFDSLIPGEVWKSHGVQDIGCAGTAHDSPAARSW